MGVYNVEFSDVDKIVSGGVMFGLIRITEAQHFAQMLVDTNDDSVGIQNSSKPTKRWILFCRYDRISSIELVELIRDFSKNSDEARNWKTSESREFLKKLRAKAQSKLSGTGK